MSLFASATLREHLIRGVIAFSALSWALLHQDRVLASLLAFAVALIAFRGCPMCWTIGLVETLVHRQNDPPKKGCLKSGSVSEYVAARHVTRTDGDAIEQFQLVKDAHATDSDGDVNGPLQNRFRTETTPSRNINATHH